MQSERDLEENIEDFPDITLIEREARREARARRERERLDHLRRMDMGDRDVHDGFIPPNGNGGNNDNNNRANNERRNHNDNLHRGNDNGEDQQRGYGQQGHRRPPQGNRPIGAFDEPNARVASFGIVSPPVQNNNFELKTGMLSVVERSTFKGSAVECPLDHLDRFERLCKTLKVNGVQEDTLKMILFPFSLEDKASYWERTIPSNRVATWGNVKTEFLKKFFPKQKTAKFRNDIQSFKQRNNESMSEAWDRLKNYIRCCPHHGVSRENLLNIFYRGVLGDVRRSLDTASYGSFASLDVDQAEQLIENLAQSDESYDGEYDRTMKVSSSHDDSRFEKLNDKLDKLSKMMVMNQKQVAFMDNQEGNQEGYQDGNQGSYQDNYQEYGNEDNLQQEDVNYVGNQGGYNNYKPFNNSHPNLSYRSTNVENPQDQVYPQGSNQGQQKPFNNNAQQSRPQQGNFQQQRSNYQQTPQQGFNQQPKPNFGSNFQQGGFQPRGGNFQGGYQPRGANYQAPSSTTNPPSQDLDIKAMFQTLIEGQSKNQQENDRKFKEVQAQFEQMNSNFKSLEGQVAQGASSSKRPMGTLPGKPEANPKEYCKAITLRSGKEIPSRGEKNVVVECEDDDEVIVVEPIVGKGDDTKVDEVKETPTKKKAPYEPPPYEPRVPYPGRVKKQLLAKQRKRFMDLVDDVVITIPLLEAIESNPVWCKFFKDLCTKKRRIEEGMVMVSYECNSIIQPSIPRKLKDPGSFSIPCSIGDVIFTRSLCDLGSSVSLMPHSVALKLGITNYKPSKISLVLADRSVRHPIGMIEDLPLKVGRFHVPTDFVVLEMDEEPSDPLILGRPFLATAGALIDVRNHRVGLQLGGTVVDFDIKAMMN